MGYTEETPDLIWAFELRTEEGAGFIWYGRRPETDKSR
jgi:hypothetical protein